MLERSSGILLPISSLPSKYGIGTLGREAYNFIDFLQSSGQKYWQILPIGPTSYGDSPYSSFSSYAGNPYFIDLEVLIREGLLKYEDVKFLDTNDEYVDYEKQFNLRYKILYKAYLNSKDKYQEEINNFKLKNHWVLDYSFFMALKYHFNQLPWHKWDGCIKNRYEKAIENYKTLLCNEIEFWVFLQYLFYEQYSKLKSYANNKNVLIIGDLPIYVAEDSVEAWTERNMFIIDDENKISSVAGVPPDVFSDEGQLWGNPVYNWGYHKKNSFDWWIKRLKWNLSLYDLVRIDHFRGFDEFWAVKAGSKNAMEGKWLQAKGKELFDYALDEIGSLNIIAEDLGVIKNSVIELKERYNFPGMKILQFAFDGNLQNPYLPQNYEENSVAYTGTHDNDTLLGWWQKLSLDAKDYVLESMNIKGFENYEKSKEQEEESRADCKMVYELIEKLLEGKSKLTIVPLQDYLCLDSKARINTPSTLGGNWMWRAKKNQLTTELIQKIRQITINSKRSIGDGS